ncbi:MAG: HEAT repeat domain-containing protein [Tepidisphaeraceae bacterium]
MSRLPQYRRMKRKCLPILAALVSVGFCATLTCAQSVPAANPVSGLPALGQARAEYLRRLRQCVIQDPDSPLLHKDLFSLLDNRHISDDRAWALAVIGQLPADSRSRPKLKPEWYHRFTPLVVRGLEDEDEHVRTAALSALGNFGQYARSAVPKIAEFLEQTDTDVALRAAQALGKLGPDAEGAVPSLLALLGKGPSPSTDVLLEPEAAAQALGQIGPAAKAAIPALVQAARNNTGEYRLQSAVALEKIDPGNEAAWEALRQSLKADTEAVRRQTVIALEQFAPRAREKVVPLLQEATVDPDWEVSSSAKSALTRVK